MFFFFNMWIKQEALYDVRDYFYLSLSLSLYIYIYIDIYLFIIFKKNIIVVNFNINWWCYSILL